VRKGVTFMTEEVRRYGVISALLEGRMTNDEAAGALNMSVRQVQRIKGRVKREGPLGIRHGNCDRSSWRTFPAEFRERVIALAHEKYFDFNFSHLSQMLEEQEGIAISRETLRKWLRVEGFGDKVRRQRRHRKRRKRSEKEGHMLFLDGSPHQWFGDEKSTLLLATDDATGKPLYGLFQKEEDLDGCFQVCREVFTRFGRPTVFYLDRASQFKTTRLKSNLPPPTQFERAMSELGIRLIFAYSPQARGRGERINRTFQDRLVAELRLAKITTHEGATRYLNKIFIPKYWRLFGVAPEDPDVAWRALDNIDLRNILCRRYEAKVNYDNTISANGQTIQLSPTKTRLSFAKALVTVNRWLDGSWHVFHASGEVPCTLLDGRARPGSYMHPRPVSETRASL
jgi:transposase